VPHLKPETPLSAKHAANEVRTPRFIQVDQADHAAARQELIDGLNATAAHTSPKFLYDALGSRLFEAITELDEYYPTRTEAEIFKRHAPAMAQAIGNIDTLVDLGAGNCAKAMGLMNALKPQRYVAVDISVDFLQESLRTVQRAHPALDVMGVGQDFSKSLQLPTDTLQGRPVFFYPGSSIGNFTPVQALSFLTGVHEQARGQSGGGGLLIGVDLVKAAELLQPAYDDALGVTAAFNLNVLLHLNRLIGSNFSPRDWQHVALFNSERSRIEMHLQARRALTATWTDGTREGPREGPREGTREGTRKFEEGERLHTENSYKYTADGFAALLNAAGFKSSQRWLDERGWFAVFWAQS
jgi:L-histidine Nalpha-methyltransferase